MQCAFQGSDDKCIRECVVCLPGRDDKCIRECVVCLPGE